MAELRWLVLISSTNSSTNDYPGFRIFFHDVRNFLSGAILTAKTRKAQHVCCAFLGKENYYRRRLAPHVAEP